MSENKILLGDCLELMKQLPENSIDAIVTDPPYGLEFMGKDWDKGVPGVHFWQEMIRVLKPGGHLLAFSGTRTYHRMAIAIEDAGFEVRDMIEWVYGSGFPKSLNIGKAVDKLQGNERDDVGHYQNPDGSIRTAKQGFTAKSKIYHNADKYAIEGDVNRRLTKGTSEWEGWGTALKPAHEPICMARKPLAEKTVAENCLKWGTGGINIDESRVGSNVENESDKRFGTDAKYNGNTDNDFFKTLSNKGTQVYNLQGRFPANLIHDNSEEVRECFPDTGQPGNKRKTESQFNGSGFGVDGKREMDNTKLFYDAGNASRFFKSIIYQAKASKSGRGDGNNHPTVKPVALMEYLITMVTPKGGVVLDPFGGSGTTAMACLNAGMQFIVMEMQPEYVEIIKARVKGFKPKQKTLFDDEV